MYLTQGQHLKVRLDHKRGGIEFELIEKVPAGTTLRVAQFVPERKLALAERHPVQLAALLEFLAVQLENIKL
jgi:hypothetical protein